MRVIGYIRVSTARQSDEGVSLDAQRARLDAYCRAHGRELVDVVTDVASAKDLERPGWNHVLSRIEAGEVDAVLVPKLDRLTRSVRDLDELLHGVFTRVALLSIDEHIDTSTANGRVVLNLVTVLSQWEREKISERTKEALAELKAQGVRCGGKAPLGLRMTKKTDARGHRIWEIVPEELETARLIVEMHNAGHKARAIAEHMIAIGARTKNGGQWRPNTIREFLKAAPAVLAAAEGSQCSSSAEVAATM